MEILKIEKPNLSQIDGARVIEKYIESSDKYSKFITNINEPDYLYWSKIKYKPKPDDLSYEEFWFLIKQIRKLTSRSTYIRSKEGTFFSWLRLPSVDELLHKIDTKIGNGQMFSSYDIFGSKQKFISRGVLEEAIASSQLEGASTTRKAAKLIILEKRQPQNESERMIVNNYRAMQLIEKDYKNKDLSIDLLFELHGILTDNILPKDEQNRFRRNKDDIYVRNDKHIAHVPPSEKILDSEIERLIDFANDKESVVFMHPVVKAIFLHFWIGYLHPFTDGNGRLARALFYWYLLKKDYWAFMYLPISSIIKKSPSQYADAYIYAEQDDYDLTYFFDYHIKKIIQSIDQFEKYIEKIVIENKDVDLKLGKKIALNERQKQLVHYLLSDINAFVTVTSHASIHSISRMTAYDDLSYLKKKKVLITKREGKFVRYYISRNINQDFN